MRDDAYYKATSLSKALEKSKAFSLAARSRSWRAVLCNITNYSNFPAGKFVHFDY
jgi:hypothetical protein